ncbi:IpaC/SipC family type III secretion system effector [Burkholderia latens]|uniref:IpaC/SipC family type III secretion system effector n=1 Tax=Burkholderia latens TaxID=488446 RepID=UPI001589883D|nr:IpaC/SipC family type III secretion system effector [Burkholderia latens]
MKTATQMLRVARQVQPDFWAVANGVEVAGKARVNQAEKVLAATVKTLPAASRHPVELTAPKVVCMPLAQLNGKLTALGAAQHDMHRMLSQRVKEWGLTAVGERKPDTVSAEHASTAKPVAKDATGSLFGDSAVDDGFDVLIALTTTLRATSVAFQKMGAAMAVSELKVTQEQAQQIVQQGEDQLEGAISGAVVQGMFSVGGAMQEFKGLKINETSLEEEMKPANALEHQALSAEQSLLGPRQDVTGEVRQVRLKATQASTPEADASESLVGAQTEVDASKQGIAGREAASTREARAHAEEQAAEQHVLDVEASPSESTWRHSQTVAKETSRMRSAAKEHQRNHENNFIKMRRWDARARVTTAAGEMASRVASGSAEMAKSQARAEETLDGRDAELLGKIADLHRDGAQKTKSVEEDLLAAVKALMNQESEVGSVVASKVV